MLAGESHYHMSTEDPSSEAAMAQLLFGTNRSPELQQTIHWPDEDDCRDKDSHSTQNLFPYDDNSSLSYSWYQSSNDYSTTISDAHIVENYYLDHDSNFGSEAVGSYHKPSPKRKSKTSTDIVIEKKNKRNIKKVTERVDHSNCCSLEDDSSESQEIDDSTQLTHSRSKASDAKNRTVKSKGKGGSSVDSQSIYARKRRERINQRLRILQGLVPNGTKVDISTMLEEAVEYVKFLQLQIKLLSSDDLWMYAPIAHNAITIGIDLKISPPQ